MCQPHLSGGQRRARPTHLGIQRAFELQHVRELLRVDVVVREVDQQPVHVKPGGGGCRISPPSPQPLSSPHTPLPSGRERLPAKHRPCCPSRTSPQFSRNLQVPSAFPRWPSPRLPPPQRGSLPSLRRDPRPDHASPHLPDPQARSRAANPGPPSHFMAPVAA